MPTKPTTIPEIWASNTLYTTGPFIGDPTKVGPGAAAQDGDRPGALFPTAAEHNNYQQFHITTWIAKWLYLGTYNPDPDAHIVETDSTGRAGLHGLTVNNTVDETAVVINGVNTLAPTVLVNCTTGASAVQADVGTSTGACFSASTGTGAATGYLVSMTGSPAGAAGVRCSADAATAGPCINVTHAGSGQGLLVAHSGTNAAIEVVHSGAVASAVVITAGSNARALLADGAGSGAGALIRSGTSSGANALNASLRNDTGFSVNATTPGTATFTARAGRFVGSGQAAGAEMISAAYYAAIIQGQTVAPRWAAIRIVGQNARPQFLNAGDLQYNSTENQLLVASPPDAHFRGLWSTVGGKTTAYNASANGAQTIAQTLGAAIWVTAVTFSATGGNAPKVGGREVVLHFRCECRNQVGTGGGPNTLNVRFYDVTAGAPIAGSTRAGVGPGPTAGFLLSDPGTGWQRSIAYDFRYVVPAAGDRTWRVEIQAATATDITVRDCSAWVDGQF